MSEPVTVDDVRRIVREENLRLLRVQMAVLEQLRFGYLVGPHMIDDATAPGAASGFNAVLRDYKEGR